MIVDVTKNLQNPLRKPSELTADEIEELKSYDATSYSMRRIGLPYVVWVYTYKTESSSTKSEAEEGSSTLMED